jgi:hypothetical protein
MRARRYFFGRSASKYSVKGQTEAVPWKAFPNVRFWPIADMPKTCPKSGDSLSLGDRLRPKADMRGGPYPAWHSDKAKEYDER